MRAPISPIRKVRLVQEGRLWCLYWVNPPGSYQWDREGIPTSAYLVGYLERQDAEKKAVRERWEVVQ